MIFKKRKTGTTLIIGFLAIDSLGEEVEKFIV